MSYAIGLADSIRDRFPNFKTDFQLAIALTQQQQPRYQKIWLDLITEKNAKLIAKKVNHTTWKVRAIGFS